MKKINLDDEILLKNAEMNDLREQVKGLVKVGGFEDVLKLQTKITKHWQVMTALETLNPALLGLIERAQLQESYGELCAVFNLVQANWTGALVVKDEDVGIVRLFEKENNAWVELEKQLLRNPEDEKAVEVRRDNFDQFVFTLDELIKDRKEQ